MARIRSVRPQFWSDPDLAKAGNDVRCLFIAIWNIACNYGKLVDDPREICDFAFGRCKGIDELQVHHWLDLLASIGKIVRYEARGQRYITICTWEQHQRPKNPGEDLLPPPPKALVEHAQRLRRQSWDRLFANHPDLFDGQESVTLNPRKETAGGQPPPHVPPVEVEVKGEVEGKGKGSTSLSSSEAKDVCIDDDAPLAERDEDFWNNLWKRTRDAIWKYEMIFPDGKPVTPDEALAIQAAIKQLGVAPILIAIETWGKRYTNDFAETGITYVFGKDGESGVWTGVFGKKRNTKSKPKSTKPHERKRPTV